MRLFNTVTAVHCTPDVAGVATGGEALGKRALPPPYSLISYSK